MSTWIQKFIDRLFGYDFFISYAHQDGRIYPKRLQERLRDDFAMRVFLDTSIEGFVVGQELNSETRRRVQASTYLVLVARPLAIQSTWVRAEIEACLAAGRRLIVIDINETLRSAPDHHSLKGLLQKRIYVSENLPGGDGEPTATTLESLSRAFQGIRREALRLRVTGAVAIFFALLSLLAGILYVSADRARSRAVWQQRISQAGLLAEQARASLLEHPQRGLLLAIESIAMIRENGKDDLAISSPVETLQEALLSTKGSKALRGKAGSWTMDFSPDGQFLAIGSEDGVVRLWLLRQPGKLEQVWQAHKGAAFVTRFSPDGARLATAGADGLVKLLPVPGRTSKALNLGGHTGPVSTLSFSSDGQLLAAGGFDGLILIWNLNNLAAHP
ncbi:MAG TPA: TIR domain-containing protein, partial [Thermoanaerobaculia bacterium]|nr:TIR domain-containing protein [Thermoanaerobaculia bacterium]